MTIHREKIKQKQFKKLPKNHVSSPTAYYKVWSIKLIKPAIYPTQHQGHDVGETCIAAPLTPPASSQHCTAQQTVGKCIVDSSPDKNECFPSVLLSSRRHTLQIPPLSRTIPQQLLDRIDMCQQHAAAAVARESQFVEGISVVSQTSNKSVSRNVFSSSFLSTVGLSFFLFFFFFFFFL